MTYLLMWRKTTPKGDPGKFGQDEVHSAEEAAEVLAARIKEGICWSYLERTDIYFPGSGHKKEKKK
jgi:hypothetical protein